MKPAMAKTIFCNVRQNRTLVQVRGFTTPSYDHHKLREEWMEDFSMSGDELSKADGDAAAQIHETHRKLNASDIKALTADDIPR
jgi:hypothetical protein